jgi:hypothetical protein
MAALWAAIWMLFSSDPTLILLDIAKKMSARKKADLASCSSSAYR